MMSQKLKSKTMETKESLISKAEIWVSSVWTDALPHWSVRSGQDKSYRWHVIHPAIVNILRKIYQNRHLRILDLGCGDGIMLDDQTMRELIANDGAYLGIDISRELLDKARQCHNEKNISFLQGNLSDLDFFQRIIERMDKWDCIVSVFVIQEIPDIESFLENLRQLLETVNVAIIVTVHPDFAEWLKQTGEMQLADDLPEYCELKNFPWRWAGYYPIVNEPHDTFFLPYFHRNIEDYRSLMERFGIAIEKIVELPDKQNELPLLVKQGFSPFYQFEKNIYWPRICEEPSALAIIARKESVSG